MTSDIESSVKEAIAAIEFLKKHESLDFISKASDLIAQCFSQGGKVLLAGNGGSLCDAMHFAEELTGRFREDRKAPSGPCPFRSWISHLHSQRFRI